MGGTRRRPSDPGHRELLADLEAASGHGPFIPAAADRATSYTTSGRPYYALSVPEQRRLARQWLSAHKGSSPEQLCRTVHSLLGGPSYEERTLGCTLLKERSDVRALVPPDQVVAWLDDLRGWAEVDSLCQSVFSADEVLAHWGAWRRAILGLARSANPNARRASLVLLTGPVRESSDDRLVQLAVEVLLRALAERDPLITKAVSWLLRALTKRHRTTVARYLDRHAAELAPLARRETLTKLETGTKRCR